MPLPSWMANFTARCSPADGLSTVSLCYFNVFGPRQNPRSTYAAAVPVFIDHALKNEPLTIHGDGEQTRDFIHVKDVAAANIYFAQQAGAAGVFNVAGGRSITINALAAKIRRLTGSHSAIVRAPERAGDVRHSVADVSKLHAAGFVPAGKIQDALPATISHFKDRGKKSAG
jgi:UDP-glucose 4-epimerase